MQRHIININSSVIDALGRLNSLSGSERTLLVIEDSMQLVGTLTDGDIRRGLLSGKALESSVREVMHTEYLYLQEDNYKLETIRTARKKGITLIPIIDSLHNLIGIHDLTQSPTILPIQAILMAGGKGERLRPLTLTTPKPLLKIGEKSIIDYNLESLLKNGITDITVTTNYLAELIDNHIKTNYSNKKIKCVKEPTFLGTIGSAKLCDIAKEGNTLVMNADLLTTVNFESMYLHHIETQSDITIASTPYTVSVPFAIFETENNNVTKITEKPTYTYYSNAGIYLINNKLIHEIPTDRKWDATDLLSEAIANGHKVTYFPIDGTWIDIGSPDDFKKAQQLMRHFNDLRKI